MAWWGVLLKNEIRDFWDVRVVKAYKCLQMNTMKILVHESFKFGGFCTWPSWSVHCDIARWLVREFFEKMNFVVFEMWGLERLTNFPKWRPLNSWCMKVLSSEGFAHGKLVGAPRHNLIGWWGVFWKNEIRGFWGVRVGKAYKCPQMNTIKFLVHESFEFGGFCTWPRLVVHYDIARWLVGEFFEINEIRGFWDVRVGKAYKCPQMSTIKFLVHESFEFEGFWTWPRSAVHHSIARWLGGEFC